MTRRIRLRSNRRTSSPEAPSGSLTGSASAAARPERRTASIQMNMSKRSLDCLSASAIRSAIFSMSYSNDTSPEYRVGAPYGPPPSMGSVVDR